MIFSHRDSDKNYDKNGKEKVNNEDIHTEILFSCNMRQEVHVIIDLE